MNKKLEKQIRATEDISQAIMSLKETLKYSNGLLWWIAFWLFLIFIGMVF
jgi:hypothetical protein